MSEALRNYIDKSRQTLQGQRILESSAEFEKRMASQRRRDIAEADFAALQIPSLIRPIIETAKLLEGASKSAVVVVVDKAPDDYFLEYYPERGAQLRVVWNIAINESYALDWDQITVMTRRDDRGGLIGLDFNREKERIESDLNPKNIETATADAIVSHIEIRKDDSIGVRSYMQSQWGEKVIYTSSGVLPEKDIDYSF